MSICETMQFFKKKKIENVILSPDFEERKSGKPTLLLEGYDDDGWFEYDDDDDDDDDD